jgi:ubiquitin C-terminal hydrolase
MSKIILFYQNKIKANDKDGYYFSDIINWSDYLLETRHDFIQWLFPDETGGVNVSSPRLTDLDVEMFIDDIKLREKVFRAAKTMLKFYGFTLLGRDVILTKEIKREEKGQYIGLYSEHNYRRITRIMTFLNKIHMYVLSSLFMLAMCYAMQKDQEFKNKIYSSGTIKYWFNCHNYLLPYVNRSENFSADSCNIVGLNYYGNSCYLDSTLLALLARQNNFIDQNILFKDFKNSKLFCSENKEQDYLFRKNIQNELNNITNTIRKKSGYNVENCVVLRELFKKCSSKTEQKFYSTKMQDAGEFLQYLFSIFNVEETKSKQTIYVTNNLESDQDAVIIQDRLVTISPIILLPEYHQIEYDDSINIQNYIYNIFETIFDENNLYVSKTGEKYQRKIEKNIISGDYLVFYAQRVYLDDNGSKKRHYKKIIAPENINTKKQLNLHAIVVHKSLHYTCYIKCGNNWFYYNDINNTIKLIGEYNNLKSINDSPPNPFTHGVLYFYS